MAEASLPQKKRGKRTSLRWSALVGIALGVIYAVPLYFVLENESLSSFDDQWWMVIFLAYMLLVGLLFFMIGFLRGRATGDVNAGVGIVLGACFMQVPIALVLFGMFSWVFQLDYMDRYGVLLALFGIDIESGGLGAAWFLAQIFFVQLLLGMFDALIGGAIGSHFIDQQSRPGETPQQG